MNYSEKLVNKIKYDTNYNNNIIFRCKIIKNKILYIIYNETVASGSDISDFVIRSLDNIKHIRINKLYTTISNNIDNFKIKEIDDYKDIIFHINSGFTVLLYANNKPVALETRKDLTRGVTVPQTENSVRGAMDSFNENIETNIGLIYKRIKSKNLWINDFVIGKYTQTKISLLHINNIAYSSLVKDVKSKIEEIDIDGIINSGDLKNFIEKENKSVFPTILTTERPDIASRALLDGKIVIIVDNSPFALIIPGLFNDFFINPEDNYNKSINTSFTRVIKYMAFYIALLTPAFYIALTTYNQEMIPTLLIINFSAQRNNIPFPAFIEALIMILSFEILRESDLRIPSFTSSALSIVGALILGEAAVNAGLVSPIMIIVIALTSIASFSFSEQDIINGLRWYRILFMFASSFMGMFGLVIAFSYYLIKMASLKSFGKPYLIPFVPSYLTGLKNSIIKFPENKLNKRASYLSNNLYKSGDHNG